MAEARNPRIREGGEAGGRELHGESETGLGFHETMERER